MPNDPRLRTLREAYLSLSRRLQAGGEGGHVGRTTAIGTTITLVDGALAGVGKDNEYNGSELTILDGTALTSGDADGTGAARVTAFAVLSGTFTFVPARGVATAAGTTYVIEAPGGQGFTRAQKVEALRAAHDAWAPKYQVANEALTTAANTYEYPIPAGWWSLFDVAYKPAGTAGERWWSLAPAYWRVLRPERAAVLRRDLGAGHALRLQGRAARTFPTLLADTVHVPADWLVAMARIILLMDRGSRESLGRANAEYAVLRARIPLTLPLNNEVILDEAA